jgi:hypothetical protein
MSLEDFSNPLKVYEKAFKIYGNDVLIKPSTRKNKKYMIYDPINNKWVHFGQMGYQDFTRHENLIRRDRYLKRATKIKGNWKNNIYSPNFLSIFLLW